MKGMITSFRLFCCYNEARFLREIPNELLILGKRMKRFLAGFSIFCTALIRSVADRYAIMITGELTRLELGTKIQNIFAPNIMLGRKLDFFFHLENYTRLDPQHTFSADVYNNITAIVLKEFFITQLNKELSKYNSADIDYDPYVLITHNTEPQMYSFVNNKPPFPARDRLSLAADVTSLNIFRQWEGVSRCMKNVEEAEASMGHRYDRVVKIRSDTYAFSEWIFSTLSLKHGMFSSNHALAYGISDKNIGVHRKWADEMFRDPLKFYYSTDAHNVTYRSPENYLLRLAERFHIPKYTVSICKMPVINVRGRKNETHFKVDSVIVRDIKMELVKSHCQFNGAAKSITNMFINDMIIPMHPIDMVSFQSNHLSEPVADRLYQQAVNFWSQSYERERIVA